MKKFLVIGLLSLLQISYGMGPLNRMNISSDQENSPTLKALIPYSEERYKANEEVTVGKDGVKIEFQLQNPKVSPIVKELVFYDSCSESNNGCLKNVNMNGWKERPKTLYFTILFGRHVRTLSNVSGLSHKNDAPCKITPEIILDNAASLTFMEKVLMFDVITGGTAKRHVLTANFVSSAEQPEYRPMEEFNEQSLGCLAGKGVTEILNDSKFKEMWNNPDYRIEDDQEGGSSAETTREVIERIKRGLGHLFDELLKSGNSEPKLLYICSSRCSLNCALRYFMNDMTLPLQLNIPNCHMFCVNYYPYEDRFQVLLDHNNMPCCISPIDVVAFAFKSPVFTPFLEEFYQEVSKVIQKKDEVDLGKIATATISRSNSFSDRRSISGQSETFSEKTSDSIQSSFTEKKSISRSSSFYIESEPISRSNSFQNKKSLTY